MAEHDETRSIIGIPPDPRKKGGPPNVGGPMKCDGEQSETFPVHPSIARLLKGIRPFKPVAFYHHELDWFCYLERDCGYVSHFIPGSNISLLYDPKDNQLVGVSIEGASAAMNLEALKKISPVRDLPKKKKK